jgi:choice-of-anchor B domain-containing protein
MPYSLARVLLSSAIVFATLPAAAQTTAGGGAAAVQAGYADALAVGPDAVFIGEANNSIRPGLVYVYRRGDADGWNEAARLTASDAARRNGFGAALALEGSTLLVSATGTGDGRGSFYVFTRDGEDWNESARVVPTDVTPGQGFGAAVALNGSVALVGAPRGDDRTGAVYVYTRAADGTWSQSGMLTAPDGQPDDRFGASVAVRGDLALVGAPNQDGGAGAVYAFRRSGATWIAAGRLGLRDAGSTDRFGTSLVLDDGTAFVGAPQYGANVGAVFTFVNGGQGDWRQTGHLTAFDAPRNGSFGATLAAAGSTLWVGAARAGNGASYVFERDQAGDWVDVTRLALAEWEGRPARFGANIAAFGDLAVVGLAGGDHGEGTAAIYQRDAATGAWTLAAEVAGEMEGFPAVTGAPAACTGGSASGFECTGFDLVSFLPVSAVGGTRGIGMNDVWGWTDSQTGREYVLAGREDGVGVVEVSDPANPIFVADLPKTQQSPVSTWRDIKVYQDHAYVVADGANAHGMQVFDLRVLRDAQNIPMTLEPVTTYDRVNSVHNIVINEETGFAYAVGASSGGETCGGGLHMIDIREPQNPTFVGCFADPQTGRDSDGYSHDAQCVVYRGPDEQYQGNEICLGANETALSIADVTDKENPVALSRASYPNVAYAHQGWITPDHRWFYMNDELDELNHEMPGTRTLVWDISDLEDPQLVTEHYGATRATDHNLYIVGDLMYQSNYQSGLRVLDISDPAAPREVGHFDTVPYGANEPGFGGSWSNFPFFDSGVIAVTSGSEGLFLVKKSDTVVF